MGCHRQAQVSSQYVLESDLRGTLPCNDRRYCSHQGQIETSLLREIASGQGCYRSLERRQTTSVFHGEIALRERPTCLYMVTAGGDPPRN
jgi:hypothetical protein